MNQDINTDELSRFEGLQEKLENFINKLEKYQIDPFIVSNFKSLKNALSSKPELLSNVDIFKAVDHDQLYESALSAFRAHSSIRKFIVIAEISRNLFVLFPVLLTWQALSSASKAYLAAVKLSPALLDRPFLLQWEEGFLQGGPLFFGKPLTFSYIAYIDAVIIGIIIVLTLIVMSISNLQSSIFSDRGNKIVTEAQYLLLSLDQFLAQFRVKAMDETIQKTNLIVTAVNHLVEDFRTKGRYLEETLQLEKDRLDKIAYERTKATEQFGEFTSRMTSIVKDFQSIQNKTDDSIQNLNTNIHGLIKEINGIASNQSILNQVIQALESHMGGLETNITQLSANQAKLLGDVKGFVEDSLKQLVGVGIETNKMVSTTRELVISQNNVNDLLTNQLSSNDKWVGQVAQGLNNLVGVSDALNNFRGSLNELQQVSTHLNSLAHADQQLILVFQSLEKELQPLIQSAANMQQSNSQVTPMLQEAVNRINGLSQQLQMEVQGINSFTTELRNSTAIQTESRKTVNGLTDETRKLIESIKSLNHQTEDGGHSGGKGFFDIFRRG